MNFNNKTAHQVFISVHHLLNARFFAYFSNPIKKLHFLLMAREHREFLCELYGYFFGSGFPISFCIAEVPALC